MFALRVMYVYQVWSRTFRVDIENVMDDARRKTKHDRNWYHEILVTEINNLNRSKLGLYIDSLLCKSRFNERNGTDRVTSTARRTTIFFYTRPNVQTVVRCLFAIIRIKVDISAKSI